MSFDEAVPAPLTYEAIVIDSLPQPATQAPAMLAAGHDRANLRAVSRAAIRRAGKRAFRRRCAARRWLELALDDHAAAVWPQRASIRCVRT